MSPFRVEWNTLSYWILNWRFPENCLARVLCCWWDDIRSIDKNRTIDRTWKYDCFLSSDILAGIETVLAYAIYANTKAICLCFFIAKLETINWHANTGIVNYTNLFSRFNNAIYFNWFEHERVAIAIASLAFMHCLSLVMFHANILFIVVK